MYTVKQKNKIENVLLNKIKEAEGRFSKNINEHLSFSPLCVYMIIGAYHRLGIANDKKCLVVSSVDINERSKGKGYFKTYMHLLSEIAKEKEYRIVFESVLNKDLKGWLLKHNYTQVPNIDNFYKDFN